MQRGIDDTLVGDEVTKTLPALKRETSELNLLEQTLELQDELALLKREMKRLVGENQRLAKENKRLAQLARDRLNALATWQEAAVELFDRWRKRADNNPIVVLDEHWREVLTDVDDAWRERK